MKTRAEMTLIRDICQACNHACEVKIGPYRGGGCTIEKLCDMLINSDFDRKVDFRDGVKAALECAQAALLVLEQEAGCGTSCTKTWCLCDLASWRKFRVAQVASLEEATEFLPRVEKFARELGLEI